MWRASTIASTASYDGNAWQHAVATLSSAGMKLYADGAHPLSPPGRTFVSRRRPVIDRSVDNGGMRIVLLACAVLGTTLAATLAPAGAEAAGRGGYVALGDSVSAGVGAPPYLDDCQRSSLGYPELLAADLHLRHYQVAACSGATTADVAATQLASLSRSTSLVTITVGGNDVGFSAGVAACLQGTDADCAAATAASRQKAVTVLPALLDDLYAGIAAKAPAARLVVLDYAHFFELTPTCAAAPLDVPKRAAMNQAADTLDEVIADRAAAAGATFVDVRPVFTGHGACGDQPWMNGLVADGAFHPNADGYRYGYFPLLEARLTSLKCHVH